MQNYVRSVFTGLFLISCITATLAQETGLQLYSLREQFKKDVPGTFALLKKWNIHEIEAGGTQGLPLPEYLQLLKDNGLTTIGVGADYNQLKTDPQSAVAAAKEAGAKYVVCFWIPHTGTSFTIAEINDAINVFNTAGKIISESGLTFCYHPHGYEFRPYEKGTLFDRLVTQTDARYVSYEMDVFWIKHPGQDPVTLLKKYPGRFKLMHIKDRRKGTVGNQTGEADVESNVVLGTGDVGIAAIMKEAKKAGIEHYFIEDESSYSVEQIPQSLDFLRHLKN